MEGKRERNLLAVRDTLTHSHTQLGKEQNHNDDWFDKMTMPVPIDDGMDKEVKSYSTFTIVLAVICVIWYFAILVHVFTGVLVV